MRFFFRHIEQDSINNEIDLLILILLFLFSCIHADTEPPKASSLGMTHKKVQLEANIQANSRLTFRYWHQDDLIQIPFEENHTSDIFGIYMNQFDLPIQNQTFSFWMTLDRNHNSEIDAFDQSIVILGRSLAENKVRIRISEKDLVGLIPCRPNTSPPSPGHYYCIFAPKENNKDILILEDETMFTYHRPYAYWQKTTGLAISKLKQVYLPIGYLFYGKCILDENSNASYNSSEAIFQIPSFRPVSGSTSVSGSACQFSIQ